MRHRLFKRSVPAPPSSPPQPLEPHAFPVYPLLWHPIRTRMTLDKASAGRVIGVEYTFDYQPYDPEFQAEVGANDVVWVPLYTGTIVSPPARRDRKRAEFDANVDAIRSLGALVRAILVGSANAEIYYECGIRGMHDCALRFVDLHSNMIAPHGRPAFAPCFEILVHDCYAAGGRLRDTLNDAGALVLSYAGCEWLVERPNPKIPEERPWPALSAYLRSLDAWSGVGLQKGLDAGSGEALRDMGYRAGFMGYF